MSGNEWLVELGKRRTGELWLVCVPYAGGGASVYSCWAPLMPSLVRLFGLQLPGRESRMVERPIGDMETLLNAAAPVLAEALREPFMLFGHSMGALVAFALAGRLADRFGLRAEKVLVSASPAPHASVPWLHNLPDEALHRELHAMGGTPAELLEHRELMELLAPTLRADLRVGETYCCHDRIACPIVAFGGESDPCTTRGHLQGWQAHTRGAFSVTMIPGDHFFIREPAVALPYIVGELAEQRDGMRIPP